MPQIQLPVILAVITNDQGQIFLIKRNDPGTTEHEKLEFPGGKANFDEDPEAAAIRETKEETGFDIKVLRLLPKIYQNVYLNKIEEHHNGDIQVFLIAYECKIIGGEFKPMDQEVLEGRFYNKNEIDYSQCLRYTKEIIDLLDLKN